MDERLLVEQLRKGDHRTFSAVFEQYWEGLMGYIVRIVRDKTAAEDLVQDTFAAFWYQRSQLEHVRSLKAYLFSIAHYKCIRFIRDHIAERDYMQSLDSFLEKFQHQSAVEQEYTVKELTTFIENEIQKLPPRMREVFVLSRMEYLSNKEIAQRLGISDKTVKKQINYSLKILRLRLGDEYFTAMLLLDFYYCLK